MRRAILTSNKCCSAFHPVEALALMLSVAISCGTADGATDSVRQSRSGKILIPAGLVSLTWNASDTLPKLNQLLEQSNAAISANPDDLTARVDRAEFRLATGDAVGACADALAVLNAHNVPEQIKSRGVLVAHFGFLRSHKIAEGKAILVQSRDRCKHDVWPYPIIACLAGDMSEKQLMDKAKSERSKEQEARLFLGYREKLDGQSQEAWRDFEWVERNAGPFWKLVAFAELKHMDPRHVLPVVDFQDYISRLQDKLKSRWIPPTELDESRKVAVNFNVHADGKVSHVIVSHTSGSAKLDEAGIAAVWSAAPFACLPQGSPDDIDVDFYFDCNVIK